MDDALARAVFGESFGAIFPTVIRVENEKLYSCEIFGLGFDLL
jgi:hypothetical protein